MTDTRIRTSILFLSALLIAGIAYWRFEVSRFPRLIDQVDAGSRSSGSAPIVIVGTLASDTLVRGPVPMHSDPKYPLQLRKLEVQVENVLKGGPVPKLSTVYYFALAGGIDGPRPLGFWNIGDRRILRLRKDSGVLRTACDGWDYCTRSVESGTHPNYRPDSRKSADYAVADLLLTRGEGEVNEKKFAAEVDYASMGQDEALQIYVIEKLGHLALTEHGEVKSSACKSLWISTQDRMEFLDRQNKLDGKKIIRAATGALDKASCDCTSKLPQIRNVRCP
jgi:hypothetical protein